MFNARQAAALTPGEHLTIDGALGLRLVATATRRTWTYRFKSPVDGRMRQVALGRWPAMPPAAALAAWERARQQRAGGTDLAQQRRALRAEAARPVVADLTVRQLCDGYLADYREGVSAATYREIDRLMGVELASIEAAHAAGVTRAQAFDLIHGMRDTPVIARRLRQALGAAWDAALDSGRLPPETPNWWRMVLRGKLPTRGRRVLGIEEIRARLSHSQGTPIAPRKLTYTV